MTVINTVLQAIYLSGCEKSIQKAYNTLQKCTKRFIKIIVLPHNI